MGTWVLHTETKGTGAHVVPLERATKRSSVTEPVFVPRKPRPRPAEPPTPRAPRRFRVMDIMTRQPLVEDGDAAQAIAALKDVRSIVDVTVYVWSGGARPVTTAHLRRTACDVRPRLRVARHKRQAGWACAAGRLRQQPRQSAGRPAAAFGHQG